MVRWIVPLVALCSVAVACGGDEFSNPDAGNAGSAGSGGSQAPADLAGTYTVKVVNGNDGCELNLKKGDQTKDIAFTVTQQGDQATGTVGGWLGVILNVGVGTDKYSGTVTGSSFKLNAYGTNTSTQNTSNECPYTIESGMTGSLASDQITGDLVHRRKFATSNPACEMFACTSSQSMTGTRPPQ